MRKFCNIFFVLLMTENLYINIQLMWSPVQLIPHVSSWTTTEKAQFSFLQTEFWISPILSHVCILSELLLEGCETVFSHQRSSELEKHLKLCDVATMWQFCLREKVILPDLLTLPIPKNIHHSVTFVFQISMQSLTRIKLVPDVLEIHQSDCKDL